MLIYSHIALLLMYIYSKLDFSKFNYLKVQSVGYFYLFILYKLFNRFQVYKKSKSTIELTTFYVLLAIKIRHDL